MKVLLQFKKLSVIFKMHKKMKIKPFFPLDIYRSQSEIEEWWNTGSIHSEITGIFDLKYQSILR